MDTRAAHNQHAGTRRLTTTSRYGTARACVACTPPVASIEVVGGRKYETAHASLTGRNHHVVVHVHAESAVFPGGLHATAEWAHIFANVVAALLVCVDFKKKVE